MRKNDNRKLNTIASYATKKFGIEYQGFLLRFCTHRNEFNCVFTFTKLRKYAIRSLIWSYVNISTKSSYPKKYSFFWTPPPPQILNKKIVHALVCIKITEYPPPSPARCVVPAQAMSFSKLKGHDVNCCLLCLKEKVLWCSCMRYSKYHIHFTSFLSFSFLCWLGEGLGKIK